MSNEIDNYPFDVMDEACDLIEDLVAMNEALIEQIRNFPGVSNFKTHPDAQEVIDHAKAFVTEYYGGERIPEQ